MMKLSFLLILIFSSLEPAYAKNDQNVYEKVTGNLICLYPVRISGYVKPIIDTKPCDKQPEHLHFFLDTRRGVEKLYSVDGSEEAINRLQKITKRKNIKLYGKISGNQKGWIITID